MLCECCKARLDTVDGALARVTVHRRAWGNSPAPWIGGPWSDLDILIRAGLVTRDPAGWHSPAANFPL